MDLLGTSLHTLGSPGSLLLFLLCVAVATFAQTLTGFAFGLILLGLATVFDIASVADVANASTVLTLVNTIVYFRGHRALPPMAMMKPALGSSLFGVAAGVALLGWLSGNATAGLRGLLGLTIVGCALILLLRKQTLAQASPPRSFMVAGLFSGLLGGLFGTSGPPMVYHMYRQPLDVETVRRALLLVFAANSSVRLVLVLSSGGFSLRALMLSALAVPLVHGVTRWTQLHPPRLSAGTLRRTVAGLLVLSGGTLIASSAAALIGH